MSKYVYPKGDFLSGFSETDEPCEYELECQSLVIRGMEYIDNHPEMKEKLLASKMIFYRPVKPLIDYMIKEGDGATGAQIIQAFHHLIYAQNNGWGKYTQTITEKK